MLQGSQGSSGLKIPSGHEKYSQEDKEKCPFFQIQKKIEDKENVPQTEIKQKKEKKMKSGCPFMPSEAKKNPGLNLLVPEYE